MEYLVQKPAIYHTQYDMKTFIYGFSDILLKEDPILDIIKNKLPEIIDVLVTLLQR